MLLVTYPTKNSNLLGDWLKMEEIVLKHNGIEYTKEDLIKMLDLVFEIVGEEV